MPQPKIVSDAALELIRVYIDAWQTIVAEQERVLGATSRTGRRSRLNGLRRSVERELAKLDVPTRGWLRTRLPQVYAAGAEVSLAAVGGEALTWTGLHTAAVQRLATDTFTDLLRATQFVREDTKRFIREAAKAASERTLTTGRTAVQGGRSLQEALRGRGISAVVYSDGSRHGLAEYAQTVVRTKTAVAANLGSVNAAAEQAGVQFFEVLDGPDCGWTRHGDADKALGKIVTVDEAAMFPISHPNCRRSFGPRPDITTSRATRGAQRSVTPAQVTDQRAADSARAAVQQRHTARQHRQPRQPRRQRVTA